MPDTADYLDDLDPDDPRTESQQIANQLRAAILTRKLQPGLTLRSVTGSRGRPSRPHSVSLRPTA